MSDTTPITLSESAIRKIVHLKQIEQNDSLKFRIYVHGGGCSGYQYGFGFEQDTQPDDILISQEVVLEDGSQAILEVIVDPMSLTCLDGAVLEYEQSLYGSHFSVKNPQAKNTCGCGNSFAL